MKLNITSGENELVIEQVNGTEFCMSAEKVSKDYEFEGVHVGNNGDKDKFDITDGVNVEFDGEVVVTGEYDEQFVEMGSRNFGIDDTPFKITADCVTVDGDLLLSTGIKADIVTFYGNSIVTTGEIVANRVEVPDMFIGVFSQFKNECDVWCNGNTVHVPAADGLYSARLIAAIGYTIYVVDLGETTINEVVHDKGVAVTIDTQEEPGVKLLRELLDNGLITEAISLDNEIKFSDGETRKTRFSALTVVNHGFTIFGNGSMAFCRDME